MTAMGKVTVGKGAAARRRGAHYVYQAWRNDECLYVGITESLPHRFGHHTSQADWWGRATHFKIEVVPDRMTALLLEERLIDRYQPRFNWYHAERSAGSRSGHGHGGVAFTRHFEDDGDAATS